MLCFCFMNSSKERSIGLTDVSDALQNSGYRGYSATIDLD